MGRWGSASSMAEAMADNSIDGWLKHDFNKSEGCSRLHTDGGTNRAPRDAEALTGFGPRLRPHQS
jgi:hypothetical protein